MFGRVDQEEQPVALPGQPVQLGPYQRVLDLGPDALGVRLGLVRDRVNKPVRVLRQEDRKSTRLTPVTNAHLVCRLLLEKKKRITQRLYTYTTKNQITTHKYCVTN